MGRLVGDVFLKAMLTDIIVKPEYQNKGYGKVVVKTLLNLAKETMLTGQKMFIEASPTKGNTNFYGNCGLKYNPEEQAGVYLWLEKEEL